MNLALVVDKEIDKIASFSKKNKHQNGHTIIFISHPIKGEHIVCANMSTNITISIDETRTFISYDIYMKQEPCIWLLLDTINKV